MLVPASINVGFSRRTVLGRFLPAIDACEHDGVGLHCRCYAENESKAVCSSISSLGAIRGEIPGRFQSCPNGQVASGVNAGR